MIDDRGATVPIDRNATLAFDWKGFVSGLVETIGNFVLKGWIDGGASGIASLGKLLMSGSIDEPPQARAWRLVTLCFAWALDDIKGREVLDLDQLRSVLRIALDTAKDRVDVGDEKITTLFLENPCRSTTYQIMKAVLVDRRVEVGIKPYISDDDLKAKIDNAFTLAVLDVWSSDPTYYASLSEHLDTPINAAAERILDWRRYRQRLVHDFEVTPTFGQEASGISLAQIYIPLRGYWEDETEPRRERNDDASLPKDAKGVWLDETLEQWLVESDPKDWLRLIGGGPGSGKSTTLRALASRLAMREGVRPLFVPLQHIGVAGDLRTAINNYFTQTTGSAFSHEPLSRLSIESGPELVILFDGLDELVAPNESAKETISLFIHKLNSLAHDLKGDSSACLKVIVSGRMLAFQAARKLLTVPQYGSLEVYGYLPAAQVGLTYPNDIWDIDQRSLWWNKYATALGLSVTLPEAFEAKELDGITHEPLLSYLLVLAGFSSHNWERAAENPNRIYATLMSDIYNRGWGETATKLKSMTASDFNLLMQTIGLAAWLGGDSRIASEASFLATLSITGADDAWRSFNEDHGPDVTNLAMNFYLKASDRAGRGFEFTHKSFGEYLAALAILDVAISINRTRPMKIEYRLQEWLAATGSGQLTYEILEFLRREVRLRWQEGSDTDREELTSLKALFENMALDVMRHGFPMVQASNFRVLEKRQVNAETAIWSIINAIVRAIIKSQGPENVSVEIPLDAQGEFRSLQLRHSATMGFSPIVLNCFTALKIESLYLGGFHGSNINYAYATINHVIFEGSLNYLGSMDFAKISRLSVHSSTFFSMGFEGAHVGHAFISDSIWNDCDFDGFVIDELKIDEETILLSKNAPSLISAAKGATRYARDEDDGSFDEVLEKAKSLISATAVEGSHQIRDELVP